MKHKFFLPLCCLIFSCATVSAQTIFSNVTPAFPASSAQNYGASSTYLGTPFTATSAGRLGTLLLDVGATNSTNQALDFTVSLYTSVSGKPGTLLEKWTPTIPLTPSPNFPGPPATLLTSVANPLLAGATQYWIILTQSASRNPAIQVNWYANDTAVTGGFYSGNLLTNLTQANAANNTPGIRLNALVTAVPETGSTALLLGLSCATFVLLSRKSAARRRSG